MRPITVTVGPLAAASATAISASQVVPGATALVLDSTLTTGYSATSIATTTSNGAATTTVTLNGSTVVGGVAILATAAPVVLVSAGNDAGKTWTVKGLAADNYTALTETVAAANASRVSTKNKFAQVSSITLSAGSAGNVSAGTNGVAAITQPAQITITSGGVDTGITFTISGTDWAGNSISEVLTGASTAAATSIMSYKTVTSIVASGASASTITVGNAATGYSPWVRLDEWSFPNTSIGCAVSGTVNYTVQASMDDPNDPTNAVAVASMTWVNSSDGNVVAATANQQSNFLFPPRYARVFMNSGTGSVTATFVQANSVVF